MSRIEFTRIAGAAIAALAALYIAYLHWQWIAGGPRPDATLAGPAFALCLGLVLLDASRLANMGVGATVMIWVGWGLLTLAVVSAAAIWGAIPWNPQIKIAWVFSAAFAIPGLFFRILGFREVKPKRKLISAADQELARRKSYTGSDEWTTGVISQEAARDRTAQTIRMWAAIAAAPALIAYIFHPAFYVFASVPAGIALVLVVIRHRDMGRMRKFGVSRLHGEFPLVRGGRLQGRIEIPDPPDAAEMELWFRCLHIYREPDRRTPSGRWVKSQGMTLDVLHKEEFSALLIQGPPGMVEVACDVPKSARVSSDGKIIWELRARTKGSRGAYDVRFQVPVTAKG